MGKLCSSSLPGTLVQYQDFADQLSEKMLAQERLGLQIALGARANARLAIEGRAVACKAGSVHQKNWMPFVVGEKLYLVFTIAARLNLGMNT